MTELPILLSVPHAGLEVPELVRRNCLLTPEQVARDGDEGAREIYALEGSVRAFVTTRVARAVVDMNRDPRDFRRDGVVKTHSCWGEPIYREPLDEDTTQRLIESWHAPYHAALSAHARDPRILCGIDGHTMARRGPPGSADEGRERPLLCLSDGRGRTCPRAWVESLLDHLERAFGTRPAYNVPFEGGYITRHHARELPWLQLEFSRAPFASDEEKREGLLFALSGWARGLGDR